MTWLQRYRVRHYVANSLWLFPILSTGAAITAVRLIHEIEKDMGWNSALDVDTARTLLGTIAASLLTAIVFICTALLVAMQLASAALTPRIIALIFRDPITKSSLTLLVFAFTFSLSALIRIQTNVPLLTTHLAAYGCLVCMAVFFYLIDHLGKALRPSGVLQIVAQLGRRGIADVYPNPPAESPEKAAKEAATILAGPPTATIANRKDGVVLAFDEAGLLSLGRRADCVIELVPQVGDHVAAGDPLLRVYGGGAGPTPESLCQSVAIGQERTLEQDPTFAFRIIVDIACKALSPAINDPTTAVLALDQIHHLLRVVSGRNLDTGNVRDAAGRLRLIFRTPDWEDFVRLAVTEIRQYGGESIQVMRRLRAMLENLIKTLPEARAVRLRQELALLHRAAERFFAEPEDRALAQVGDSQGVGGKHAIEAEAINNNSPGVAPCGNRSLSR